MKKVGRNFKALCPFHKERTPSFYISPERQLAYCFGCKKGGDHFKFIEEIEGLDFRGALKFLAEKTGVQLPQMVPEDKHKKTERDHLIEIHDKATEFFEKQLWETDAGKKALSYLKKRDMKEETIRHARLGFSGEVNDGLYTYLLEKGFTRSEILVSGLAIARDMEQDKCVDRFRNRLMFPIQNLSGDICAFGGRAIKEGDEPKYLNSPETPIFHKSSLLYGLFDARGEIRTTNKAVIVEGYMDAIGAHQAGFKNVVACGGTALTEDQLVLIKRFTKNLILSFDRDNAGKMATDRSIELAFAKEFLVKVAVWDSKAKDPDECIRENPKAFTKALDDAFLASDYLLKNFAESFGKDGQGKKKTIDALLPFFAKVSSPVELDEWLKQAAVFLDISLTSLYDELKRFQGKQKSVFSKESAKAPSALPNEEELKKKFKTQEYLLGLLLTYPELRSLANQLMRPEDFGDIELQNIYRSLTTEYNQSLDEQEASRANVLAMFVDSLVSDMKWEDMESEVKMTINTLLRQKLDGEKRSMLTRLNQAQGQEKMSLLESYQELISREEKLRG